MKVYNKKLYKSKENKILTGVMGGLGEYTHINPSILRATYIGLSLFIGIVLGVIFYILIAIIVPKKPEIIYIKTL